MIPVSPVLPSAPQLPEVVIAKDQKEYMPLPIHRNGEYALSRWRMSWKERFLALFKGNIYLWVITPFTRPFPPVMIQVEEPTLRCVLSVMRAAQDSLDVIGE